MARRGLLCLAPLLPCLGSLDVPDTLRDLLLEKHNLQARVGELALRAESLAAREMSAFAPESGPLALGARRLLDADGTATCLDALWLLVCGFLVMFMQSGFAFLESGSCRKKNYALVLMKNMVDVCIGTVCWWLLGYGLAYGVMPHEGNFIGEQYFAGTKFSGTNHYRDWFFQWAFCATSATIVSGGVAERVRFPAYSLYSCVMTVVIYPLIVYWTWSGYGYLSLAGYSDFAGSGIVHLTGGIGALVGAVMLGPRRNVFASPEEFNPHSITYVVMGTFFLWFGWYGFNCGSTLEISSTNASVKASLVAMNTTLSASTGGLTMFLLRILQRRDKFDLAGMCNGILAGLVACCAGVDNFYGGMAVLVGFLGALAYEIAHVAIRRAGIDDPLDAFPVHGAAGTVGCLLRAFCARQGADGSVLLGMLFGIVMIAVWSGGLSFIIFGGLRFFKLLRVDYEEEEEGGDSIMSHSPMKHYVHRTSEGSSNGKKFEI